MTDILQKDILFWFIFKDNNELQFFERNNILIYILKSFANHYLWRVEVKNEMILVRTFPPQLLTSAAELASSFEQSDFQRVVLYDCFRGQNEKQCYLQSTNILFTIMFNKHQTNMHFKWLLFMIRVPGALEQFYFKIIPIMTTTATKRC